MTIALYEPVVAYDGTIGWTKDVRGGPGRITEYLVANSQTTHWYTEAELAVRPRPLPPVVGSWVRCYAQDCEVMSWTTPRLRRACVHIGAAAGPRKHLPVRSRYPRAPLPEHATERCLHLAWRGERGGSMSRGGKNAFYTPPREASRSSRSSRSSRPRPRDDEAQPTIRREERVTSFGIGVDGRVVPRGTSPSAYGRADRALVP